ncbi:MAG: glycerol-3-phosphate acyltransferase [Chloroflexi bacterium]|nr:glycerol-3-phosphate acyltransferase [Chloroflexota bacterium]
MGNYPEMIEGPIAVVAGYLLGSVPTAYLVVRQLKSVDIRRVDVGNVGAASTFRVAGPAAGVAVALADITKGAVTVLIAGALGVSQPWLLAAGLAAVLGHSFPVYIGFRGGQGMATVAGVFLVLAPAATSLVMAVFILALLLARSTFAALSLTAPLLPLLLWLYYTPVIAWYSLGILAFIGFRNRRGLAQTIAAIVHKAKR